MRRALLTAVLATILAGCAVTQPRAPGRPDPAAADRLLARLWTELPGVWRVRQSVTFEGRGVKLAMQGFLELDTRGRRARLAGLDDLGVTLFTMTVTPAGMETGFLLPGPGRGDLPAVVASGVRRVYLDPLPDRADALLAGNGRSALVRGSGGRETTFTFGPEGLLVSAEAEGEGEAWRAEYGDYRDADGVPVPRSIVLEDRAADYRLSITQDEVRREIPGHD